MRSGGTAKWNWRAIAARSSGPGRCTAMATPKRRLLPPAYASRRPLSTPSSRMTRPTERAEGTPGACGRCCERRCRRARLSVRTLSWTGRATMRDLPPKLTDHLAPRAWSRLEVPERYTCARDVVDARAAREPGKLALAAREPGKLALLAVG